jgi:hypothetical protein
MTNCGWKFNYKGGHFYEFSDVKKWVILLKLKNDKEK